jgi:hypothetical protein
MLVVLSLLNYDISCSADLTSYIQLYSPGLYSTMQSNAFILHGS